MKKNDSKYYSFDDIYIEFIIVEDDNNLSVFGYVNIQQKKVRVITDMSSSLFIKTDVYNSEFHNTEISKNILAEIMILVGSPTKYKNEEDGTVIAPLLSMDSYLSNKKYFKFCIKNVLLKFEGIQLDTSFNKKGVIDLDKLTFTTNIFDKDVQLNFKAMKYDRDRKVK